jgi:ryanodine receptor 2
MNYVPRPIDTSAVTLPPELLELTEQLAEHAHDVWARERMAQGWTYGARRDDERKHHPCLIPYADLPESEKVYDRNAAIQTLKAIVALGYRLGKE